MSESKKEEQPHNKKLLSIVDEFLVDLECLREMNSSVIPILQEKDKERKAEIAKIFDIAKTDRKPETNTDSTEQETPEISNDSSSGEQEAVETSDEPKTTEEESDKEKFLYKFKRKDIDYIIANSKKIKKAEQLFEKQLIVTLVSRFDDFLGQLLRLALSQNPDWIISSEKTISYKELIALKSVDIAIEGIIQKEVENLLRGSHEEQIQYIDDKLKIGIADNFSKLKDFYEVAERRNLFVHTGGSVSHQYLDKCKSFGFKSSNKVGDKLTSNEDYFNSAFLVYFEMGLRIAQASYRRVFPDKLLDADRSLNNLAVKFMNLGEYYLSEIITEFDIGIPKKLRSDDSEFLYFAKINRAISYKFQGKDFEVCLNNVDWQVFHPKYALSLHVLREEYADAAKLMHTDEIKSTVGKEGIRTWPIFRFFRETSEFKVAYKEVYNNEYTPDLEKDLELKIEQENKALETES